VTHLRKMMLEELQRRNYAETTIRSYIRTVEDFSPISRNASIVLPTVACKRKAAFVGGLR
jgi:hypothetical protein